MADDRTPQVSDTPRKRPKTSRKSEQHKKQRLSQHTVGPDYRCSRFKCFQYIAEDERQVPIERFNGLASKNEQDSYLASCISVASVARRRPREESANQMNQALHTRFLSEGVILQRMYKFALRHWARSSALVKSVQLRKTGKDYLLICY